MRKILLILSAALLAAAPALTHASVLVSWNTTGNAGTETSEPAVFTIAGLTGTPTLTLGTGVTPAGNTHRFGGTAWLDAGDGAVGTFAQALAQNEYFEFTVTPAATFNFTPTSLAFIWDRSGTGPNSLTLRSSVDSYGSDLSTVTGLPSANTSTFTTMSIPGLTNLTTATTFRLYGFGTTNVSGTGGFDTIVSAPDPNVILNGEIANGAVAAVPEFSTFWTVGICSVLGLWKLRGYQKLEGGLV